MKILIIGENKNIFIKKKIELILYRNKFFINQIKFIKIKNIIMANFDGSGPQGQGSKTGRGAGNCNTDSNNKSFDSMNKNEMLNMFQQFFNMFGRGRRTGRGNGFGQGNGRGNNLGQGNGRGRGNGQGRDW